MWLPAQILLWNPWNGNELLWMPIVLYLCSADYCFIPCILIVFIDSFNQNVEYALVGKHCLTDRYWVKACLLAVILLLALQWGGWPKLLGLYGKMCLPAKQVSETISRSQLMFVLLSPEDICISLLLFLLLLGSLMCLFLPFPPAPFYLQMECEGDLVLTLPRVRAHVVWTGHTSKPTLAVTTCHHQTLLRT